MGPQWTGCSWTYPQPDRIQYRHDEAAIRRRQRGQCLLVGQCRRRALGCRVAIGGGRSDIASDPVRAYRRCRSERAVRQGCACGNLVPVLQPWPLRAERAGRIAGGLPLSDLRNSDTAAQPGMESVTLEPTMTTLPRLANRGIATTP